MKLKPVKTIYAITIITEGPRGHGEPSLPYLSLATDGQLFELGSPRPLFESKREAERVRQEFDLWNFYKVTPLTLMA